jgi:hypothetical protein
MKKLALSALIACAATSAFAQTAVSTEYYLVRDPGTKKCIVVDKKPTSTTSVVDDGISFRTRAHAETAMKAMKVCTTDQRVPEHED